jgi:putative ABC transport system substrate-binding protein
VDRRRFLLTSLAGALAAPHGADAQQPTKVARIGYLTTADVATAPHHLREAFLKGLRDLGYVEGRNLVIEIRSAEGKFERLPALAAELVALKVDVILAPASVHVLAAKQATRTIPIVFVNSGDPVASGLVTSLAQPGRQCHRVVHPRPGPDRQVSGTAPPGRCRRRQDPQALDRPHRG